MSDPSRLGNDRHLESQTIGCVNEAGLHDIATGTFLFHHDGTYVVSKHQKSLKSFKIV